MIQRCQVHKRRNVLRKTLSTTNPIESAFSVGESVTRRVKRWRDSDTRLNTVYPQVSQDFFKHFLAGIGRNPRLDIC